MLMASKTPTRPNPVARHSRKLNKAVVFRDRTKYVRANKHKGKEPYSTQLPGDGVEYGSFIQKIKSLGVEIALRV